MPRTDAKHQSKIAPRLAHRDMIPALAERVAKPDPASQEPARSAVTYRKRRLLVTTVTLESAMAAEASIGESRPSAATGMPMVL